MGVAERIDRQVEIATGLSCGNLAVVQGGGTELCGELFDALDDAHCAREVVSEHPDDARALVGR